MTESYAPSDWTNRVRKRVRATIAESDFREAEVARRAGWTQSYMARRLTARKPVPLSVADIEAIARVLGIPPTDLIPSDREAVAA